jgi:uncharacterized membrane protein
MTENSLTTMREEKICNRITEKIVEKVKMGLRMSITTHYDQYYFIAAVVATAIAGIVHLLMPLYFVPAMLQHLKSTTMPKVTATFHLLSDGLGENKYSLINTC